MANPILPNYILPNTINLTLRPLALVLVSLRNATDCKGCLNFMCRNTNRLHYVVSICMSFGLLHCRRGNKNICRIHIKRRVKQ